MQDPGGKQNRLPSWCLLQLWIPITQVTPRGSSQLTSWTSVLTEQGKSQHGMTVTVNQDPQDGSQLVRPRTQGVEGTEEIPKSNG